MTEENVNTVVQMFGISPQHSPLKDAFLRWQCRVRQIAMRENQGRPDDSIMPTLTLDGEAEPMGQIITVLSRNPGFSLIPELQHIVKRTNDPAQRRSKALEFLSETYFQRFQEFSDVTTATFEPGSAGAEKIKSAKHCTLTFDAYGQEFTLACKVWKLPRSNPLYQATWWHNAMFNPGLSRETIILGFEPDWSNSGANPPVPMARPEYD